jgi:hypothetical protein
MTMSRRYGVRANTHGSVSIDQSIRIGTSEVKKSYIIVDLYVKLWYTYRMERGEVKMDFFGRCLVACAVCYLIIHVIVALYIR